MASGNEGNNALYPINILYNHHPYEYLLKRCDMEHIIKTDRLILQPLCEADIGFMQELIARPEAYFYDPDMQESPDDVAGNCQKFIKKAASLPNEGGIQWVVKLGAENIGEVHVQCNWEKQWNGNLGTIS